MLSFPRNWKSREKWLLQHGGIDIGFVREGNHRESTRQTLGIPQTSFVVGHVGRFAEAKNHQFFIRVAKELASQRNDVRFLMVGDGPLRSEIETIVREQELSKAFVFTGARSDIPEMLSGNGCLSFPITIRGLAERAPRGSGVWTPQCNIRKHF